MRVNLDIQSLRSFIKVAEVNNFTRAAELINLTQPAISQQIRRLEELLDQPLFIRENKQVLLTLEGEKLLKYAKEIITANDKIADLFLKRDKRETLILGLPEHFCETVLPEIITKFSEQLPAVQIVVKVARSALLAEAINEGKIDIGIVIEESTNLTENIWHKLSIKWFARDDMDVAGLHDVPLALFKPPCGFRRLAIEKLEEQGLSWHCAYESEDLISLRTAVRAGVGITVLPYIAEIKGIKGYEHLDNFPPLPEFSVGLKMRTHWRPDYKEQVIRLIRNSWTEEYLDKRF
jgi:DNA-binding transcriptional LysR family regulator